jgi:hypothetical protein
VIRADVSVRALARLEPRKTTVALIGQAWRIVEGKYGGYWVPYDLDRVETVLQDGTPIEAGQELTHRLEHQLPATAAASLDTPTFRILWQVAAWMDFPAAYDPRCQTEFVVISDVDLLRAMDPSSLAESLTVATKWGGQAPFRVTPAPLVAGQPFGGSVDLDHSLAVAEARVELRLAVPHHEVLVGHATLTAGPTAPNWYRYDFTGVVDAAQFASGPVDDRQLRASLDLVVPRPLLSDHHVIRPVAISTTGRVGPPPDSWHLPAGIPFSPAASTEPLPPVP